MAELDVMCAACTCVDGEVSEAAAEDELGNLVNDDSVWWSVDVTWCWSGRG